MRRQAAVAVLMIAGCGVGHRAAAPPAGPRAGQPWAVKLDPATSMAMVWIPPGHFVMGSPPTEPLSKADERPQTEVTLTKGYWLGRTMVTVGQWKALTGRDVRQQLQKVIADDTLYDLGGKQQTIRDFMRFSMDADPGQYLSGEGMDLPMYFVSWNDAVAYCAELTARERAAGRLPTGYVYSLPTEAQFEYACRAGTAGATYAGPIVLEGRKAAVVDRIAWYAGNSTEGYVGKGFRVGTATGGPHQVALKEPNAWGLYDMTGNIWQWCADGYGPLPGGSVVDWAGPASATDRVNRGGSFGSGPGDERSAARAKNPPAEASAYRGFRLALAATGESRQGAATRR